MHWVVSCDAYCYKKKPILDRICEPMAEENNVQMPFLSVKEACERDDVEKGRYHDTNVQH